MKKWYEIVNKADKSEVWIYEQIGEDFWSGGGVTAKNFQKDFSKIKSNQIDLHINSPGGEVFDGITIYNMIKNHPAKVTTYIDGLAASIASVIALSGDEVIMADNALFMMHNPYGSVMGDSEEMRKFADTLDKVTDSIVMAYVSKSGKSETDIRGLMGEETWLSATEAYAFGFVDTISEQMDMAAMVKFTPIMAKAQFKHIPDIIKSEKKAPDNERDLEDVLRDAGYTRKEAKSIIACGFKGVLRDAEPPEEIHEEEEVLRDAEPPPPIVKDRMAVLLTKAELFIKPNKEK